MHTHMEGFTETDIVLVYVCQYGKNNKRRKVKVGAAHREQGGEAG